MTTSETGTFSVFVPTLSGSVNLEAKPRDDYTRFDPNYDNLSDAANYTWFDPPANRPDGSIAVIPGQVLQFGTFTGYSVQPRITSVKRGVLKDEVEDETTDPAIAPSITPSRYRRFRPRRGRTYEHNRGEVGVRNQK